MNKSNPLTALLCLLPIWLGADSGFKLLQELKFEKDPEKRKVLQDKMQNFADRTTKSEFDRFDSDRSVKTANPLLKLYDSALDHVKQDIAESTVKPGNITFWYLYNMGFIIKTPTVCFGVDIHHRRAVELAELLDFLVITHNHTDHHWLPLLYKMTAQEKPVVSNFFTNPFYTKATEYTHNISGVTIHCGEADHNRVLKKFTMPMEIICPTGDKNFVFFTSGDCWNESFLNKKSEKIDLYAVHPYCGMKALNAAKKLTPQMTFLVHLHEMSHEINRWRWSFDDGRREQNNFIQADMPSYIPVWGEKFTWDGEKISTCQQ